VFQLFDSSCFSDLVPVSAILRLKSVLLQSPNYSMDFKQPIHQIFLMLEILQNTTSLTRKWCDMLLYSIIALIQDYK
jgi:hypothetical protein